MQCTLGPGPSSVAQGGRLSPGSISIRNKHEGQSYLLVPAVSQVSLTPNSMLERHILGMTYSELFTRLSEYNMQCLFFFFLTYYSWIPEGF